MLCDCMSHGSEETKLIFPLNVDDLHFYQIIMPDRQSSFVYMLKFYYPFDLGIFRSFPPRWSINHILETAQLDQDVVDNAFS